jgi:hypothetical protein
MLKPWHLKDMQALVLIPRVLVSGPEGIKSIFLRRCYGKGR